jgi:O-antigen/teichoic acid export membrane protein
MSLVKQIFFVSSGAVFSKGTNFITLLVVAKLLNSNLLGIYSYFLLIINFLGPFIVFGFAQFINYSITEKSSQKKITNTVTSFIIWSILISSLLYVILFFIQFILNINILNYINNSFSDYKYLINYTILISSFLSINLVLKNVLISLNKSKLILHSNFIEGTSFFVLLISAAFFRKIDLMIFAYGFTQLLVTIFVIYKLKKYILIDYKTISFNQIKQIPLKSYKLASGDLLWSFLNLLFMSLIATVSIDSLGNFHIANQVAMAILFIPTAIQPVLASHFRKNNNINLHLKFIFKASLPSVLIVIIALLFAPYIANFYDNYKNFLILYIILTISIIPKTINTLIAPLITSLNYQWMSSITKNFSQFFLLLIIFLLFKFKFKFDEIVFSQLKLASMILSVIFTLIILKLVSKNYD